MIKDEIKTIKLLKSLTVLVLFTCIFVTFGCSQTKEPEPQTKKTPEKYLYYLHGRIIEDLGADKAVSEKFGKYEYKKILKNFEDEGFEVISEVRPKNTDVKKYAKKIADDIRKRLKLGASMKQITVVGASKGSLIAMLVSTELGFEDLKFVLMGNCNKWVKENFDINLHGKILSIYEKSDTVGGNSCEGIKSDSKGISEYKEIEINTNLDHGYLYKTAERMD